MAKKALVIFGAGSGAVKVVKTLRNIGVTIDALSDNDKNKWGSEIEGLPVIEPVKLKDIDCDILIASDYQEEIEKQLGEMEILHRLVIKEHYIMEYLEKHLEEARECLERADVSEKTDDICNENNTGNGNGNRVLIDLFECTEYGGIEIWSYMVGQGLSRNGYKVNYLGNCDEIRPAEDILKQVVESDISYECYWESVLNIAKIIIEALPCTLIVNRQGQTLIAASLVRRLYPDMLKVISIIHTDRIILHRRQGYMKDEVDYIAGVSRLINDKLVSKFGVSAEKVRFKESPVDYPDFETRRYSEAKEEPIKIGYAARITKTQKRVDLLPLLVEYLENANVPFVMQVAGEGSYLPKLRIALEKQTQSGTVEILGQISREQMKAFWKRQDVFINMSEFEGTSLSMLEAMSYGVVPIVTEVSGVTDIIAGLENGFVCKQHDIKGMQEKILALHEDRGLLVRMGNAARETIRCKCNREDYIQHIIEMIEG